jgi:hypothetical protein
MKCSPMHFPCLSFVLLFAVTYLLMSLYSKLVDDVVYEVDCQMITIKKGADVDIGMSFLFLSYLSR